MLTAASWWYQNLAPHTTPTEHIDFLWGVLHGILMVPNLIYALLNDSVTIYQSPNEGVEYSLGYVLGALVTYCGAASRL